MKKASALLFLLLSLTVSRGTLATDTLGACLSAQAVVLDEKNEGVTECQKAVIALKTDPDYEKKFRSKLNQKMTKLVATQTKQIMQELGTSSDFYEQND